MLSDDEASQLHVFDVVYSGCHKPVVYPRNLFVDSLGSVGCIRMHQQELIV